VTATARLTAQAPVVDTSNPTQTEEDALAAATAQHWETMVTQLKAITDSATDLASLQRQMMASFGALPSDELVRVMAAGFALAELKGIADVSNGN
jgi:DNA-binding transcriptional regulator/RsmH inhibitor MraZ